MKKLITKLIKLKDRKVAKNAMWMVSERIIQMIISLFVGVISARYLGPDNYGTLNYGLALVTLFSSIAKLGLENVIVKEYINKKEQNGLILGSTFVLRMISGFLSIICIMGYIVITDPNNTVTFITTLLQSFILIFEVFDLIDFWFQSQLKSKYVAIAKTIAYIVMSIYKILLLILGKSVEWFAFATSLEYIVILSILLVMYFKNGGQKLKCSLKYGVSLLKQSYHFIISGLLVTLYTQMDKIMIGNYLDDKQVGLYSAATAISTMWGFIPNAIINSMRPTIYEAKEKGDKIYEKRLKQLYAIVFWSGIVFSVGITMFSKFIINILYGQEYLGASASLSIAVWSTTFAYLGTARGVWIVCENKNKYTKYYVLFGAIFNLVANFILIPLIGINGAAIATLISQIIVAILAPLLYKETRISVKHMMEGIFLRNIF